MSNHQGLNNLVGKLTEHVTADAYFGNTRNNTNENTTPSDNIRHWTELTDVQIMNMSDSQKRATIEEVKSFLKGRRLETRNRQPLEALLLKIDYEQLVQEKQKASTISEYRWLLKRFNAHTNSGHLGSYKSARSLKSECESKVASLSEQQGLCRFCGEKLSGLFKKKCKKIAVCTQDFGLREMLFRKILRRSGFKR